MTQLALAGRNTTTIGLEHTRPRTLGRFPRWALVLGAVGAQITFALVLRGTKELAILHVGAVTLAGLYSAVMRKPVLLLIVLAHLTGAEVLWRQSRASVFYMTGPYLVMALCGWAVITIFRSIGSTGNVAILYALALVPSSMITINLIPAGARELLAFALAGPLALALAVTALSQLKVSIDTYRQILWVVVVSAFGPWAYAVGEIREYQATVGAIDFRTESNFITAGGFGPVHVSAALSAGTVAAMLLATIETRVVMRALAAVLGSVLIVQSLLTFSRGGMYSAAIAAAAIVLASVTNRRALARMLVVVGFALLVGYVAVLPRLESFTQGAFSERFSSTETSRSSLASGDVQAFLEHPVFGLGPGLSRYRRIPYDLCQLRSDNCDDEAASHTEFTRMMSEHGMTGIMALGAFIVLAIRPLGRRARSPRFMVAPWIAWVIAQMAYANLRIVAVPVLFGMAFLQIETKRRSTEPQLADSASRRERFV